MSARQDCAPVLHANREDILLNKRDEYRSLYLPYLRRCNERDFDGMASFYTPTIKVDDVIMEATAVAGQFAPVATAFPEDT
ncbi:nuclear transport factor 2 family protein [Streptomyces sp. NPDC003015]